MLFRCSAVPCSGVPLLLVLLIADETLCNKINNSFINVMENYIPLSDDIAVPVNVNETPITVTESAVARKLRKVKTSRSRGPDEYFELGFKNIF